MSDSYERLKAQFDRGVAKEEARIVARAITPIYDRLALILEAAEVGDDGYARFGSTSDLDRLRDLVRELEQTALVCSQS